MDSVLFFVEIHKILQLKENIYHEFSDKIQSFLDKGYNKKIIRNMLIQLVSDEILKQLSFILIFLFAIGNNFNLGIGGNSNIFTVGEVKK